MRLLYWAMPMPEEKGEKRPFRMSDTWRSCKWKDPFLSLLPQRTQSPCSHADFRSLVSCATWLSFLDWYLESVPHFPLTISTAMWQIDNASRMGAWTHRVLSEGTSLQLLLSENLSTLTPSHRI